MMNKPENPIGQVFDQVFNEGIKSRSVSDAMDMLYPSGRDPKDFLALFNLDKRGLIGRVGAKTTYDSTNVADLESKLLGKGLLPQSGKGVLQKLSESGGQFFYDKKGLNLFYRVQDQVVSLPLEKSEGVVSIGGQLRKTNTITQIGKGYSKAGTFSSFYYEQLGNQLNRNIDPRKLAWFITNNVLEAPISLIGGRGVDPTDTNAILGPKLSAILGSPTMLRGRQDMFSGGTAGLKTTVVQKYGVEQHPIFAKLAEYNKASAAYATLVKSGGRALPLLDSEYRELTLAQAFNKIASIKESYANALAQFTQGNSPLSKADFLFNRDSLVVARSKAAAIFGNAFTASAYEKGLHQLYNMTSLTGWQTRGMAARGMRTSASFLTEEGFKYQQGLLGKLAGTGNAPIRVGVLDFADPMYSRLMTQEGGAIITGAGKARFRAQLPVGNIKLTGFTEKTIGHLESLFDTNLSRGNQIIVSRRTSFSREDVKAALQARDPADFKQLTGTQKDVRALIDKSRNYKGVWKAVADGNAKLSTITRKEGVLSLDFVSSGMTIGRSSELVVGARRFTGIIPSRSHALYKTARSVQNVDLLVSADEFNKMLGPQVYLDNFFDVLRKYNKLGYANQLGSAFKGFQEVRQPGAQSELIPLVSNTADAYTSAQQLVRRLQNSTSSIDQAIANEAAFGYKAKVNDAMRQAGIKGMSTFTIGGGLRTDYMLDINNLNTTRILPSRLQMIARGSRMLGYDLPSDDPLYRLLTSTGKSTWQRGLIGLDPRSLDFTLSEQSVAKQYLSAMAGRKPAISADQILTLTDQGLIYNGRALGNIPTLDQFAKRNLGVDFKDLSGTALDRKLGQQGILYVDMGREVAYRPMGFKGNKVTSRYIPIPTQYIQTTKGVNNRLTVNKNSRAASFIQALNVLQANPKGLANPSSLQDNLDLEQFYDYISQGNLEVTKALTRGTNDKRSLIEKENTILTKSGARARLVPQMSQLFDQNSFKGSGLFDVYVTHAEMQDLLQRKMGSSPGAMWRIKESLRKNDFTYVMLGADPSQRPEHLSLARLKVVKDGTKRQIGQLNLQMNPVLFRMFERDTDRDVLNLVFLEGMEDGDVFDARYRKAFDKRLAKQEKLMDSFAWFAKYDLMKEGEVRATFPEMVRASVEKAKQFMGAFVGQKANASLGYTITRAVDRVMPLVVANDLKSLGLNRTSGISADFIEKAGAPFKDSSKIAIAQTLAQNIYQGGVQKGADKVGLAQLGEQLTSLGDMYKNQMRAGKPVLYGEVVDEATKIFDKYLASVGKNREFMALDYVLQDQGQETLQLLKQDLEAGSAEMLSQASKERIERLSALARQRTARLLGEYYGPGTVINSAIPRNIKNVTSVFEDTLFSGNTDEVYKRVIEPVIGEKIDLATGSGTKAMAEEVLEEGTKSSAFKGFAENAKKFLSTPSAGKLLAGGALGGALAYAMFGPRMSAPLPPPTDNQPPTDYGPRVQMTGPPKIYDSQIQSTKSASRPAYMNNPETYSFPSSSRTNITVKDNRNRVNPGLMKKRMDQAAESDF